MNLLSHSLSLRALPRTRLLLAAAMVLLLSGSAAVAAPIIGTYMSDDMDGGVFLTGRFSEGFTGLPPDPNGVGNGAHAGSWDGANLYTQWELTGPALASYTMTDNRVGGEGTIIFDRVFGTSNAFFTLKSMPWWTGAGDGDYSVDIDFYRQTVTVYYETGFDPIATSVESFHGTFVGYAGYELTGQGAGAMTGQGAGAPPAGFPSWIPAGALAGLWGEVGLVQIEITPEPATLGLMGLGLAALLARRRK